MITQAGALSREARAQDETPALVTWRSLLPACAAGAAIMFAVALMAICWGTVRIPPWTTIAILLDHLPFIDTGEHARLDDAVVWDVRAPRVATAMLAGATLGFAGAAYQAVFRNPLAEPYFIGVAAGASVGATLVIVSPIAVTAGALSPLPLAAFAGAMIAVTLAYLLARSGGSVSVTSLILTGVTISALGTAVVTYLMLTYTERTIEIVNWIAGGFNTASWSDAQMLLPYLLVALAAVLPFARLLNALQLDEDEARHLGVNVEAVKLVVLAMASLATAAAVAISGVIGFVGLLVPHSVRMVWGTDYRRVLPLSAFMGASFMVIADVIARSIDPGHEVPIGVITAFIGAPFFLYILRRYTHDVSARGA